MENLFEGADYLFRVFAENKVGASQKAAELQIPIRAKMPYGKNLTIYLIVFFKNKVLNNRKSR